MPAWLIQIAEWGLEKIGFLLYGWYKEWQMRRAAAQSIEKNKENTIKADESGDLNAIRESNNASLNNTSK